MSIKPVKFIRLMPLKQEVDLPTRYSNYTGNSDKRRGRFTY